MDITLFQTLEDRGNPDEIEQQGPFHCRSKTAWLGPGYYFWDTHSELGHWWGKTAYADNYVVCRARAIIDETCFDLHGNGEHRIEFTKACDEIIKKNLTTKHNIIVPAVIKFLANSGKWPFSAIRALAIDSISYNFSDNFVISKVNFKLGHKSFLDLRPPIQLCLLKKRALSLKEYVIVHPEQYIDYQYA